MADWKGLALLPSRSRDAARIRSLACRIQSLQSGGAFEERNPAMVFSNLTFVCLFLPITLALYFSSPKWLHNAVLVAASIVFYIWGGRIAIVLVLVSIAVNFHLGQAIAASDAELRDRLIRY